jgi:hypothetical protein
MIVFRIANFSFEGNLTQMKSEMEDSWSWLVDANGLLAFSCIYGRKDILTALGNQHPFRPKMSSFII